LRTVSDVGRFLDTVALGRYQLAFRVAVLGPEWRPVVPVIRILVIAMVGRTMVMVANQLFDALRQPHQIVRLNGVRLAALPATIFQSSITTAASIRS
jgi:O-antigen/teichoic acid export membrane protein